jgi:hypothetical protein
MLEVFIAYTKGSSVDELEATLDGWDLDGLEPVAIECGLKKYELIRRVTAEKLSKGHYVLAEIGFAPVEEDFGARAERFMADHPRAAIVRPIGGTDVCICRKGVIDKWPTPRTTSYTKEHREACELKGYEILTCPAIHYHPIKKLLLSS